MKNTVNATLSISLWVSCPHCEDGFDLFEINNGALNDEGGLMQAVCPNNEHWSDSHERFADVVDCPQCHKEVAIEGVAF
jgi:hypothetical protein